MCRSERLKSPIGGSREGGVDGGCTFEVACARHALNAHKLGEGWTGTHEGDYLRNDHFERCAIEDVRRDDGLTDPDAVGDCAGLGFAQ